MPANNYRPCVYRQSLLGIFQCEKHYFQHAHPSMYDDLYEFCLDNVPDRFCPHVDFVFNKNKLTIQTNLTNSHHRFRLSLSLGLSFH